MKTMCLRTAAALCALLLAAGGATAQPATAGVPSGERAIVVTTGDGQRVRVGSVRFEPQGDGVARFAVTMDTAVMRDHFLSMREFKCLEGGPELTCHVPYPHAQPGIVRRGDAAWLEHALLFFYKRPADFGAKLWNGLVFDLKETATGYEGTPRAVDLNVIAAPPPDATTPPLRGALRDAIAPDQRWVRSLSIE